MNRRQAIKGGFLTAIASIIPLPVLRKAIELHDVIIDVDKDNRASMTIDGNEKVSLNSFVLRLNVYNPGVKVTLENDGRPRLDLKHPDEKWN